MIDKRTADAAQKLFQAASDILDENDSVDPTESRAGRLPREWRRPLVAAANEFRQARDAASILGPAEEPANDWERLVYWCVRYWWSEQDDPHANYDAELEYCQDEARKVITRIVTSAVGNIRI